MSDEVQFLDLDDVLGLAELLLGGQPPIRDIGLLGSAVARPQTTLFGEDAYPSLCDKAAALLQSIVINHALVDGNKRLGWLSTAVFLQINGLSVSHVSNDEVYDFIINIATNNPDLAEISQTLRQMTAPKK
jgi:death-on-curing protein